MKRLTLGSIVAAALTAGASSQSVPNNLEKRHRLSPDATSIPQYVLHDLGNTSRTFLSRVAQRNSNPGLSRAAQRISNSGLVGGDADPADEKIGHVPFVYRRGRIHNIGLLRGGYTSAGITDLNERGEIVGVNCGETDFTAGFLYTHGRLYSLSNLLQYPIVGTLGINNHGWLVGTARWEEDGTSFAFIYSNGTNTILPGLIPGGSSFASDINDAGDIIGSAQSKELGAEGDVKYHAVIYSDGRIIDLGALPGADYSAGARINQAGHAIGWSRTSLPGQSHAFLYKHGVMQDLGALPGDVVSRANGINNYDIVVGSSVGEGTHFRGVLFINGTVYDLNSLLVSSSNWFLEQATDINDQGVITGIARVGQYGVHTHAVVLKPVQ